MTLRERGDTTRRLERLRDDLVTIDVDAGVLDTAEQLVYRHTLRAIDAVHLASAMTWRGEDRESVAFACWDARLWDAARAEGFPMLPTARS